MNATSPYRTLAEPPAERFELEARDAWREEPDDTSELDGTSESLGGASSVFLRAQDFAHSEEDHSTPGRELGWGTAMFATAFAIAATLASVAAGLGVRIFG